MTNFHSDTWIMENIQEHYKESLESFSGDRIIGIFCQGSQNYNLDTENSDIDTKLIITPTLKDIAMNNNPISTTHIRANNEHLDTKDVRLYIQTFRKQNPNFLEILFTPYSIISPFYIHFWLELVHKREEICRMNPARAARALRGVAVQKYCALKHPYPSKLEILAKYGYDSKQLHHLVRMEDFIKRYIDGETYEQCLQPSNPQFLIDIKQNCFNLAEAEAMAASTLNRVNSMVDEFCKGPDCEDKTIVEFLEDIQYRIIKTAIEMEMK